MIVLENEWTNKMVCRVHYSRFISSWVLSGGNFDYNAKLFVKWLRQLGWLSENEIQEIKFLAVNGKLELQENANKFLRSENEDSET